MTTSAFDRSALSHEARKLLEALLGASDIGRAQIPASRLREDSGLTEGALIRARSELTRNKLLRTEPGVSANGLRGANVYVLDMLTLDPPEEKEVPESVPPEPKVEDVLEVQEEVPESSGRHRSERRGFLGFFRRGDKAS